MWSDLDLPWQACLEEAWEAYCTGSVPIGAVVTDGQGQVLSRGRNRIFDAPAPAGQVCQTELAHAELNALLSLGIDQGDRRSWALYTTTEPCPLCLGAFYMSGIRTLYFASRDPWAGSVNLLGTAPYLSRKPIQASGPASGQLEAALVALFVEWELQRYGSRMSVVREKLQDVVPAGVRLGQALRENGELGRWQVQGRPAAEVFDRLGGMLL